MISNKATRENIGIILLLGTLFSVALVGIGGIMFLMQHGVQPVQAEILSINLHYDFAQLWHATLALSPQAIILLGIFALVATQILRVALLLWFYIISRDVSFSLMSFFILIVLVYSSFWRK